MQHDSYFAKIQALVGDDSMGDNDFSRETLQDTQDKTLWRLCMENVLTSARTLMLVGSKHWRPHVNDPGPESEIWKALAASQAVQAANRAVNMAMRCLPGLQLHAGGYSAPSCALFRALNNSARVLCETTQTPAHAQLRRSTVQYLERIMVIVEAFWSRSLPYFDIQDTEYLEEHLDENNDSRTAAPTVVSSSISTPRPPMTATPAIRINDEDDLGSLDERRELLDDFENLWNPHIMEKHQKNDGDERNLELDFDLEMFLDGVRTLV